MDEYRKLNDEEIEIIDLFVTDDDGNEEIKFGFEWQGKSYAIDDFIRTHNNPWVSGNFPDYIHAYQSNDYYNPIYIELIDDCAVNVYERVA